MTQISWTKAAAVTAGDPKIAVPMYIKMYLFHL